MPAPWRSLTKPETMTVVAPDGLIRWKGPGYFSGTKVIVDDVSADVQIGDEVRRRLPNGNDDTWMVEDTRYFDTGGFPAHYQVHLKRKGTFAPGTGGYLISVTGNNARVNIHSTDNSVNSVVSHTLFADMRRAIEDGITDEGKKRDLIEKVNEAEQAVGTPGYLRAYQAIISTAADHLGVITPFLPALTQLLG